MLGGDATIANAISGLLLQHPDVVAPRVKKFDWIDPLNTNHINGQKREVVLHEKFLSRFPRIGPRDFKITGDVLDGLLYSPEASAFFGETLPEAKKVIILSDPRTRAYLDFNEK